MTGRDSYNYYIICPAGIHTRLRDSEIIHFFICDEGFCLLLFIFCSLSWLSCCRCGHMATFNDLSHFV